MNIPRFRADTLEALTSSQRVGGADAGTSLACAWKEAGDAHVIRNADGVVADNEIRSLYNLAAPARD